MSEFNLMRAERWGERRSAVRRFGLSSVILFACPSCPFRQLPSFASLCNYFNYRKHRGDPALLVINSRGFKCKASDQLLMEDLCVHYSTVNEKVSLLYRLSTIQL